MLRPHALRAKAFPIRQADQFRRDLQGFPDIQRLKIDMFRERVQYSETLKKKLAAARKQGAEAVRTVEEETD